MGQVHGKLGRVGQGQQCPCRYLGDGCVDGIVLVHVEVDILLSVVRGAVGGVPRNQETLLFTARTKKKQCQVGNLKISTPFVRYRPTQNPEKVAGLAIIS